MHNLEKEEHRIDSKWGKTTNSLVADKCEQGKSSLFCQEMTAILDISESSVENIMKKTSKMWYVASRWILHHLAVGQLKAHRDICVAWQKMVCKSLNLLGWVIMADKIGLSLWHLFAEEDITLETSWCLTRKEDSSGEIFWEDNDHHIL